MPRHLTRMEEFHHCLIKRRDTSRRQSGGKETQTLGHPIHTSRDILYKKSYSSLHPDPYLRCLGPEEARKVMQKIHDGYCGNHKRDHSLAHKVINQRYY